ncbi:hypothetical protein V8C40DRAFT_242582 [Trichoderma camerunense]
MFSTVMSKATRAAFSTSARALKPADVGISASARSWRNLSPQSRRYITYGVATCLVVDGYLVYNYAPWIVGLEKKD